jgi:hypothetical protein
MPDPFAAIAKPIEDPFAAIAKPAQQQAGTAPRTWTDSAGDAASEWWKQVNPLSALEGLANAVNHPIDTGTALLNAQGEVGKKAAASFKQGDYVGATRHAIDYLLPVIGPQIDQAGDLVQSGQYAKGAGMTAGIGTNIAAPELIKGVNVRLPVGEVPERLYQSALKPSPALATSKVQGMIKSGLDNQIPVSAAGIDKLQGLISDLGDKVSSSIQAGSDAGATIDPQAVAQRADQIKGRFAAQVNPNADLAAIEAAKQEFLNNNSTPAASGIGPAQLNPIPVSDAQAIKQGTYQQLKDRAYGAQGTAVIEAQKALARGIKEELETQFPEIQGLNAQQGQAASLNKALTRAVQRIDNHQLIGLGTPLAATAGWAAGGAPGAIVSGVLKSVLDQPEFKSKLAYTLSRAGKGVPISAATARIATYSNQLGNATTPDDNSPPTNSLSSEYAKRRDMTGIE